MTMDAGGEANVPPIMSTYRSRVDFFKKIQDKAPPADITTRARSKAIQGIQQPPDASKAISITPQAGQEALAEMWSSARDATPPHAHPDEFSKPMSESPGQSPVIMGTKAAVGIGFSQALQTTKSSADPKIGELLPKVWQRSDSKSNIQSRLKQNAKVCTTGIAMGCHRTTLNEVMNRFSSVLWGERVELDPSSKTASGAEFMTVASTVKSAQEYEKLQSLNPGSASVKVLTNLNEVNPEGRTKAFFLTKVLGEGSFGIVNEARVISRVGGELSQTTMAYKRSRDGQPDVMLSEARNLKRILLGSNPLETPIPEVTGLPSVHEVFAANGEIGLLMRVAKDTMPDNVKSDLDNKVQYIDIANQDSVKKALIIKGVTQLAMGLAYMHQHGNIHGDLKRENTYILPDQWTLADFGDASLEADIEERRKVFNQAIEDIGKGKPLKEFTNNERAKLPPLPITASAYYVPHGEEEVGRKETDVFALAIVMAEIAIGAYSGNEMEAYVARSNFPNDNEISAIWDRIQDGMEKYDFSEEFQLIIGNCIEHDRDSRLTAQQLVEKLKAL